jgi:hypothetical protein
VLEGVLAFLAGEGCHGEVVVCVGVCRRSEVMCVGVCRPGVSPMSGSLW